MLVLIYKDARLGQWKAVSPFGRPFRAEQQPSTGWKRPVVMGAAAVGILDAFSVLSSA